MAGTRAHDSWWRGGVIYQIYPRSFADSNRDGVGDLPGITGKLDYVARLGVDAIWLSPFFKSPMKDFGYDISDYRDVDPIFGTLGDFDLLIDRAHALGLKVIIDQVYNHSSDAHAWFVQSRGGRDAPKSDWYVWADAKADGSPPNNWLSIFGGPAWQWDTRRRQYYLHNFLASQPDLNFHCRDVQDQVLAEMEFWLQRGVDGLRLDVVNFYFHDRLLRDNPPWGERPRADGATPANNPYSFQRHQYDKTQPENIAFLRRLRELLDRYGATTSVGEIGDDDPFSVMAEYTGGGDKLHMAYIFNLLTDTFSAEHIRRTIEQMEAKIGDGWPCWSFGNHDVARVMTRWGGADAPEALAKVLMALLLSLRGSACIYQGEELALTEAEIPRERLQDPYGINFWPEFKGRDGCRTPMPWVGAAPHAGFSAVEPWLPVAPAHRTRAVDAQQGADRSVLNAYRAFLAWRRGHAALRTGSLRLLDAPADCIGLMRESADERIVAAFNLGASPCRFALPAGVQVAPLEGHGFTASVAAGQVALPAFGAFFGRVGA